MNKRNGFVWVWALIIVAVIVLAGILYFATRGTPKGQPTYAPQGQLTSGFPKELVLDGSGDVSGSYAISYATSTKQYTAVFSSNASLVQLFTDYQNYLKTSQWTLKNVTTKYAGSRGVYATNATADVNVSIIDQGTARQVTVSYLVR